MIALSSGGMGGRERTIAASSPRVNTIANRDHPPRRERVRLQTPVMSLLPAMAGLLPHWAPTRR